MKIQMSDVFNAEMAADDINVYMGPKLIRQGDGEDKFDCADRYAAHAINCHDELVQELQNVLDHHSDDIGHLVKSSIKEALRKARGEQ